MRTIAATVSASGSAVLGAESAFPKRSRLNCWLLPFCSLLAFVGGITPAWPEGRDLSLPAKPLRAHAFGRISPKVIMRPTVSGSTGVQALPDLTIAGPYPWKYNITTTVFWIGEQASPQHPISNEKSAWDPDWVSRYGGLDNPDTTSRRNFIPTDFVPGINPFYVALPYNDVDDRHTKPEAAFVIPWFKISFVRDGESVCKGRWLAIRHAKRVCYAQWEDVGPFSTDHWQYVFGPERPRFNVNQGAGLDVSPAVREYLGLSSVDHCDWKFLDFANVPFGPWSLYGEGNPFVRLGRKKASSPP